MFSRFPPLPKLLNSHTQWLEKQQTSILSAAAIITVANIISAASGFIRERLLLGTFYSSEGPAREAYAAFKLAFQVPDILFQLIILGALSAAFIPVFSNLKKKDERAAQQMAATVLNILLLSFCVVGAVVFVFAEPITALRTGEEFTPYQLEVATTLTRIMLVGQLFFAVSNLLSAYLQSYQRFILPSIAPILYNVGILVGVYLLEPWFGIYAAGVGVVLGALIHMLTHIPLAAKLGFRPVFSLNYRFQGVRELLSIAPARILTIATTEVQTLGLGFFATSVGSASYVLISLALSIITIPIRFFGIPISQAALSFLSKESASREHERFKELVIQSLNHISFLTMPTAILVLILRVPIVRFLFGTDTFPWSDTVLTGKIVAILALSIAAQAMSQLLLRAFYALKDTRTPFIITLASVLLFLSSSAAIITLTDFGILGIATTIAVSEVTKLFLLLFFFDARMSGLLVRALWIPQVKILIASFFMAVFLYLPFRILDQLVFDTSRTVELIGLSITTSAIGILVYLYFAALLDIKELRLLTNALGSIRRWGKNLETTQEVIAETSTEDTSP